MRSSSDERIPCEAITPINGKHPGKQYDELSHRVYNLVTIFPRQLNSCGSQREDNRRSKLHTSSRFAIPWPPECLAGINGQKQTNGPLQGYRRFHYNNPTTDPEPWPDFLPAATDIQMWTRSYYPLLSPSPATTFFFRVPRDSTLPVPLRPIQGGSNQFSMHKGVLQLSRPKGPCLEPGGTGQPWVKTNFHLPSKPRYTTRGRLLPLRVRQAPSLRSITGQSRPWADWMTRMRFQMAQGRHTLGFTRSGLQ